MAEILTSSQILAKFWSPGNSAYIYCHDNFDATTDCIIILWFDKMFKSDTMLMRRKNDKVKVNLIWKEIKSYYDLIKVVETIVKSVKVIIKYFLIIYSWLCQLYLAWYHILSAAIHWLNHAINLSSFYLIYFCLNWIESSKK